MVIEDLIAIITGSVQMQVQKQILKEIKQYQRYTLIVEDIQNIQLNFLLIL